MAHLPTPVMPNFDKPFVLETSGIAIGTVLSQEGIPLTLFSKKMCPRLQKSSVYVQEMYAITESVKKWSQYLLGHLFHIYTDQQSLKSLLNQTIQSPEQQK